MKFCDQRGRQRPVVSGGIAADICYGHRLLKLGAHRRWEGKERREEEEEENERKEGKEKKEGRVFFFISFGLCLIISLDLSLGFDISLDGFLIWFV